MTRCVGCGKRDGDPCADCLELLDGVIVVRRALWLEVAAILLSIGLLALDAYLFRDQDDPVDAIFFGLFCLSPAAWGLRGLAKPFRFRLDRETLDVHRVLGLSRTLDLSRVESNLGCVVDTARNRRYRVGEVKFPGADRFHRALRVRRVRVAGSQTA